MYSKSAMALNDGNSIPRIGLGVWQTSPEETAAVVSRAIQLGYRHIDTASSYGNEIGVGEGVRQSQVNRREIFLTTKVWNDDHGFDKTLFAFDASLKRIGFDYLDLYLIHWPVPSRGQYTETWRALARLKSEERVRSIGVSNFEPFQIDELIAETGIVPAVNQIEVHPLFQQNSLRGENDARGIVTQAWRPLGKGSLPENALIKHIALKHERTPAQVILRWHLQNNIAVIPKTVRPERLAENLSIFDFELDAVDMESIAGMDAAAGRMGPHPMDFG